ncbi:hypothetical protein JOQ06_028676 [Pogonophryne albipinna]|uniref:Uncharacterized protein n=1 Tax=Pogonophryne albipinna TaxID=1090488 RepID=A0AAD6BAD2_9TELE|nr:hypothetical protein JOQ06_028676 [Pogonophryne albipinna]
MAKRRYDSEYMKYGFLYIEDKREGPKPQCVVCSEILARESMKPSKMKRHLETKHSAYKDKPVEFFQRRLTEQRTSQQCLTSSCSKQEQALRASYLVAQRIAKSKKPPTIAEDLILPAAIDMVRELLDQSAKLKTIPLSNDTISKRIEDMSDDIQQQTTARIKASAHYALQMDKSTDIASHAILLVYVRHVWEGDLQEQFLCTRDLQTTTTAEDIFSSVDLYLGSVGLNWDLCVGITTDGAASMTGKHSGVVKRILEKAPNATWQHCFLHREALAAKDMVPVLHETLKDVIKAVNHIKEQRAPGFFKSCAKTWAVSTYRCCIMQKFAGFRGESAVITEYASLATHAIKIILPFSTTYLCESGFSALVQLKTKQRNKLNIEHDLRVALSTITPDFETLVRNKKHPQLSH